MAWTRTDGVIDNTLNDWRPVKAASTSTVVRVDDPEEGIDISEWPAAARSGADAALGQEAPSTPPPYVGTGAPARVAAAKKPGGGQLAGDASPVDTAHIGAAVAPGRMAAASDTPDIRAAFTASRLRMFGVSYSQIDEGVLGLTEIVEDYPNPVSPSLVAAGPREWIAFIDSDARGEFVLSPGDRLYYTAVPSGRVVRSNVEVVTDYSANQLDLTVDQDVRLAILYKDPFVVRVPDTIGGGWLMLLSRVRFRVEDLSGVDEGSSPQEIIDAARATDNEEIGNPGLAICDIVGWHCDSQTFRTASLRGPFLVVDSLRAIMPNGELCIRTRAGAPTGIFCSESGEVSYDEGKFYVYFNINRSYQVDQAGNITGPDPVPGPVAENQYDTVVYSTWETRFRSGVGVQAIYLEVVEVKIWGWSGSYDDPWLSEDQWDGDINEPVRYFLEDENNPGNFRPMNEVVAEAARAAFWAGDVDMNFLFLGEVHPRSSDPAAIHVDSSPTLIVTLTETSYAEDGVANIVGSQTEYSSNQNTLLGMWRFQITSPVAAPYDHLFGRDLYALMVPRGPRGNAADQITRSFRKDQPSPPDEQWMALDADPVWLADDPSPTVRIYTREDPTQMFYQFNE